MGRVGNNVIFLSLLQWVRDMHTTQLLAVHDHLGFSEIHHNPPETNQRKWVFTQEWRKWVSTEVYGYNLFVRSLYPSVNLFYCASETAQLDTVFNANFRNSNTDKCLFMSIDPYVNKLEPHSLFLECSLKTEVLV